MKNFDKMQTKLNKNINIDLNLICNKLKKAANNEKQLHVLDNISDFKLN